MYCPDCGKQNPAGQKFCRSCGLSLKPISQALAGKVVPVDPLVDSQANADVILKGAQRFWQNPFIYALLLVLFGGVIAFFGDALHARSTSDIGSVIALLGIGLLGFKGVMLIIAPPRYPARSQQAVGLEEADERIYQHAPPSLRAEPPSVTETTTRQLDANVNRGTGKARDTQPTL